MNFLLDNPVFFKETRTLPKNHGLMFQRLINLIIYPLIYLVPFAVISLTFLPERMWEIYMRDFAGILRGCFLFGTGAQFLFIIISALGNTQFSFTREKEQKTYDSLISTTMSPTEILLGKLYAGIYPIVLTLLVYSPAYYLIGLISGFSFWGLATIIGFSIVFSFFCGILGLFSSIISNDSKKAQSTSASIIGAFLFGTWILDILINFIGIMFTLKQTNPPFPIFTFLNPGAGYASAMFLLTEEYSNAGLFKYLWIITLTLLTLISVLFWRAAQKRIGKAPQD